MPRDNDKISSTVNSLLSIWIRPRSTIRSIINNNTSCMVIPLAGISGIFVALDFISLIGRGNDYSLEYLVFESILVGFILGIIILYFFSFLFVLTGRLVGGQASHKEMRTVWAWSHVITITSGLLWIPNIILFGIEPFKAPLDPLIDYTPTMDASPILTKGFMGMEIILTLWFAVVFIICLSEAQKISLWKALINAGMVFLISALGLIVVLAELVLL